MEDCYIMFIKRIINKIRVKYAIKNMLDMGMTEKEIRNIFISKMKETLLAKRSINQHKK